MTIPANTRQQAQDLLDFIDASPSPWHAVATCEQRLQAAGFARLDETERWTLQAGDKRYVVRGDAAIIAFVVGCKKIDRGHRRRRSSLQRGECASSVARSKLHERIKRVGCEFHSTSKATRIRDSARQQFPKIIVSEWLECEQQ